MIDETITFRNISVEQAPGESHILVTDAGGEHGPRNSRPMDVIKESVAVGKLIQICMNDSLRQDKAIKSLEGALGQLADQLTVLVKAIATPTPPPVVEVQTTLDVLSEQGFGKEDDMKGKKSANGKSKLVAKKKGSKKGSM